MYLYCKSVIILALLLDELQPKHEDCAQHIISMENAEYLCFKLAMAYKENQIYYGK